jgi:hypothetical protein
MLCGARGCGAWVSGSDTGSTEAVWRREASRRAEYEWHGRVRLLARWKRSEAYVVRHERLRAREQAASRLCACPAHQPLGVDVSFRNPCGSTQHAARSSKEKCGRLPTGESKTRCRRAQPATLACVHAPCSLGLWEVEFTAGGERCCPITIAPRPASERGRLRFDHDKLRTHARRQRTTASVGVFVCLAINCCCSCSESG